MRTIAINDLNESRELDRKSMEQIYGGVARGVLWTAEVRRDVMGVFLVGGELKDRIQIVKLKVEEIDGGTYDKSTVMMTNPAQLGEAI